MLFPIARSEFGPRTRKALLEMWGWSSDGQVERFYDWLVGYLDGSDPVELISAGAPPREYEPEARDIMRLLPKLSDPEAAAQQIYAAFLDGYENSKTIVGEIDKYRILVGKIFFAWQRRDQIFKQL